MGHSQKLFYAGANKLGWRDAWDVPDDETVTFLKANGQLIVQKGYRESRPFLRLREVKGIRKAYSPILPFYTIRKARNR